MTLAFSQQIALLLDANDREAGQAWLWTQETELPQVIQGITPY